MSDELDRWVDAVAAAFGRGSAWEKYVCDVNQGGHLGPVLEEYRHVVERVRAATLGFGVSVVLFIPAGTPESVDEPFPELFDLEPWSDILVPRLYVVSDAALGQWLDRSETWTPTIEVSGLPEGSVLRGVTVGHELGGGLVEWSRDLALRTTIAPPDVFDLV